MVPLPLMGSVAFASLLLLAAVAQTMLLLSRRRADKASFMMVMVDVEDMVEKGIRIRSFNAACMHERLGFFTL